MPELAGFEPRYDAISAVPRNAQPTEGLRPLYWWARDLRSRGDILTDVRFDVADKAATVTVRLASYRSVTVVRRTDLAAARPSDLPSLIAEAIWRLGALGWTAELFSIIKLLGQQGLIVTPAPVRQRTDFIPDGSPSPTEAYGWPTGGLRPSNGTAGSSTAAATRSLAVDSSPRFRTLTADGTW